MTDDWHKAFQAQRAGRSALLTNKQREDLKKPYVDASDRDAARAAERWEDKVKQAAKAQEVKRFIDEAFPNEMDLEPSLARPGPVRSSEPRRVSKRDLKAAYIERVEQTPAGHSSSSDDLEAMRKKFPGASIPRRDVEELRRKLAPKEWTAPGKRKGVW